MKKFNISRLAYILIPLMLGFLLFIWWRNHGSSNVPQHNKDLSGKELAARYCQMCHEFPDPGLLDKRTWTKSVLPNMGMRLGIREKGANPYKGMDPIDARIVRSLKTYPDTPLISKDDWAKIVKYFDETAPNKLPPQVPPANTVQGTFPFEPQFISIGNSTRPQVTVLKYDQKTTELYVGDDLNLYALKNMQRVTHRWELRSPATHIEFERNSSPLVSTIGKFKPSDQKLGALSKLTTSKDFPDSIKGFSHLQRPVFFATADLNMDNKKDVVICNFGNHGGRLSWFEDFDPTKEHVLSTLPGSRKVEIKDLNGDHKPDIVALMAQAREQVDIYYNKGNGEFREKTVLKFPPVYGVNYFEMADFNDDGFDDLVVTNGDNWDYSSIDKPYHGIRIYLNDGKDNFKEAYFFPMYDCSKALVRDFDGDGDPDIVAISLYSNYSAVKDLKKSFVYLSNEGNLKFAASFLPENVHSKWMTMTVGDFNHDHLLDVALGAYIFDLTEMVKVMAVTGASSCPQILILTQKKSLP